MGEGSVNSWCIVESENYTPANSCKIMTYIFRCIVFRKNRSNKSVIRACEDGGSRGGIAFDYLPPEEKASEGKRN